MNQLGPDTSPHPVNLPLANHDPCLAIDSNEIMLAQKTHAQECLQMAGLGKNIKTKKYISRIQMQIV